MKLCLVTFAVFGSLIVFGCGGDDDDAAGVSSPVEACKSLIAILCKKSFNGCYTEAELDAAAGIIGNNEADCNTKLGTSCTTEGTKCDSGQTYKPESARDCIDQYESLSCDELEDETEPAACALVCG